MSKEKTAKELGEIMSEQLDLLRADNADQATIQRADSISNMIGKIAKMQTLELKYAEMRKGAPPPLPSLTR